MRQSPVHETQPGDSAINRKGKERARETVPLSGWYARSQRLQSEFHGTTIPGSRRSAHPRQSIGTANSQARRHLSLGAMSSWTTYCHALDQTQSATSLNTEEDLIQSLQTLFSTTQEQVTFPRSQISPELPTLHLSSLDRTLTTIATPHSNSVKSFPSDVISSSSSRSRSTTSSAHMSSSGSIASTENWKGCTPPTPPPSRSPTQYAHPSSSFDVEDDNDLQTADISSQLERALTIDDALSLMSPPLLHGSRRQGFYDQLAIEEVSRDSEASHQHVEYSRRHELLESTFCEDSVGSVALEHPAPLMLANFSSNCPLVKPLTRLFTKNSKQPLADDVVPPPTPQAELEKAERKRRKKEEAKERRNRIAYHFQQQELEERGTSARISAAGRTAEESSPTSPQNAAQVKALEPNSMYEGLII